MIGFLIGIGGILLAGYLLHLHDKKEAQRRYTALRRRVHLDE